MIRVCLLVCGLVLPLCADGGKSFSANLPEAEFKSAGLDKLSAEERARLDELVAKNADGKTAAAVAAKARETMKRVIVKGRVAGVLSGWQQGTVIVLEDGQRLEVLDAGRYRASPVRRGPAVQLFPLSNGNYIMTVDTVPRRAQVKALKPVEK